MTSCPSRPAPGPPRPPGLRSALHLGLSQHLTRWPLPGQGAARRSQSADPGPTPPPHACPPGPGAHCPSVPWASRPRVALSGGAGTQEGAGERVGPEGPTSPMSPRGSPAASPLEATLPGTRPSSPARASACPGPFQEAAEARRRPSPATGQGSPGPILGAVPRPSLPWGSASSCPTAQPPAPLWKGAHPSPDHPRRPPGPAPPPPPQVEECSPPPSSALLAPPHPPRAWTGKRTRFKHQL